MFGIGARMVRARTVVGRASQLPLLVRGGVFVATLAAFVVGYPMEVVAGRGVALLVLAAAWPAVAPRGHGATATAVLAVGGWVLNTTFFGTPVTLLPVLSLATLLYLAHTLAALAAALPYDGVVDVSVVTRWLLRAAGVVLAAAVLTVAVLAAVGRTGGELYLAATIAGLGLAVTVAGLLSWLLRRP
jgi:hypothetical protein